MSTPADRSNKALDTGKLGQHVGAELHATALPIINHTHGLLSLPHADCTSCIVHVASKPVI